jgi:hypothetical protein
MMLRGALFAEYLIATRVIISRKPSTAAMRGDSQCGQRRLILARLDVLTASSDVRLRG